MQRFSLDAAEFRMKKLRKLITGIMLVTTVLNGEFYVYAMHLTAANIYWKTIALIYISKIYHLNLKKI